MILTIVVAAVSFSYYKRSSSLSNREKQTKLLAENISDSTQGFSFSQADHGKTIFEFRAKSKLGLKDNKILLEYITVKVYGKDGDASSANPFTLRGTIFQQADSAAVNNLLNQSVTLGPPAAIFRAGAHQPASVSANP